MKDPASIPTTRLGMRAAALLALIGLFTMLLSPVLSVRADDISNNIDASIDTTLEAIALTAGGANGTVGYFVQPRNGDGDNGCNIEGSTENLVVSVTSSNTAVATVSPATLTFDSCGDTPSVTVTPLTQGSTTISLSQSSNNTGGTFLLTTATFTVNVAAPTNTAPTLSLPGNQTAEATGPDGAIVTYTATANDTQDGDLTPNCNPPSGSTFPLGPTTVSCSVTDSGSLSASGNFTVTVVDTAAPVVTVPGTIIVEATGAGGAQVSFTASATDTVSGTLTPDCNRTSGTTFSIGATTVTCRAEDAAGNEGQASFDIIVQDTTAPEITVPDDITREATSAAGAVVSFEASATDSVDGALTVVCVPASGATFDLGTTTVTCSATDAHGNTGSASFDVTVVDSTGPVLNLPDDIATEATGPSGAAVTFSASALDAVDGEVEVTCVPASGSTFPLGVTTVNCSALDSAGNESAGSFTVTVGDTTAPVVTVPADFQVEATGAAGATATFSASALDLVDGDLPVTCVPASNATFNLGQTTVTCTATDAAGNTGSESFVVTVADTTGPVISAPNGVTEEATSALGADVTFTVTASDLVDGEVDLTCTPASGTTFPLGTTEVTCSATDAAGNTSTASFDVTVQDTTAPVITEHSDVSAEATGPDGATVSYDSPTTSDAVDGEGVAQCTPPSGSTFALGSSLVTCTATDAAGNEAEAVTFNVIVVDTTAPTVTAPADQTVEATGPGGAAATYREQSASDLVDGPIAPTCLPASGSTFPLGLNSVTCLATDDAGNTGSATFTITVVDTTAPDLTVPADMTVEATSGSGAAVTFSASATDLVDGSVPVTCVPTSGSTFPLGESTVECSATDAAANTGTKNFKVTVVDTTPPSLSLPANQTVEATSAAGAAVSFTASATDLVDVAVSATCTPVSGSTFALGTTTVNCSATDAAGNTASDSFDVTVEDTTEPDLSLPANITAEATGPSGAVVTFTATANDIVDGAVTVTCSPASGSTFSLGNTTVNCSASDAAGNAANGSFTVTVQDTTAPSITVPANITVDPTGISGAVVTYSGATATDLVDGSLTPTCTPASDTTFGFGTTTVTCAATDAAGNAGSKTFTVMVRSLTLRGFYQPVDMNGIYNNAKSGSTVPLKFEVFAGSTELTNTAVVASFKVFAVPPTASLASDDIEVYSTGNTSLRYDATGGQFIQNWKTPGAGTYKVVLTLTDGTTITAYFNIKK